MWMKLRGVAVARILAATALSAACMMPAMAARQCDDDFLYANQLAGANPPDYTDAIKVYNKVLQDCPTFDKGDLAYQYLAYAYLQLKQVDNAVRALEAGVQKYPTSQHIGDLQRSLGTAYISQADALNQQDPARAKPIYQKAIGVLQQMLPKVTDPKLKAEALFNIGNAQFNTGDYAAAARTYTNLMVLTPSPSIGAAATYNMANADLNVANGQPNGSPAQTQAYEQAAAAFNSLITKYPTDPNVTDAKLQRGKILVVLKNYPEAIAAFKPLIDSTDKRVRGEALNGLGYAYVDSKQYALALPLLRRYVQEFPGTAETNVSNVRIGYILRTQDPPDLEGALAAYRAAVNSKDVMTSLSAQQGEIQVAVALVKANKDDRALAIYQTLMNSTDPKVREDAAFGRAIALTNTKNPTAQQALAEFLRAYPNSGGTVTAAYQLGVLLYGKPDFPGAADAFVKATQGTVPPGSTDVADLKREALYWAGASFSQAKQPDRAVTFWNQAIQADPQYKDEVTARALVDLGQYYVSQGQDAKAEPLFQAALMHYPTNPITTDALLALAIQAVNNKQFDRAIRLYTQIVQAQPRTEAGGTAQYNIGAAYLQMTPPQPAKAASAFTAYLANFPTGKLSEKALLGQAESYEALGNVENADRTANLTRSLQAYKQVAALSHDAEIGPRAAWKAGVVQGRLNQYEPAIQTLDAAIAKYPTSNYTESMVFERGQIYFAGKQNAQALKAFQSYIARYPTGPHSHLAHFKAAAINYDMATTLSGNADKETDDTRAAALRKQASTIYAQAATDFEASVAAPATGVPLDQAYYFLGWAYANSDQRPQAVTAFKALVTKYPTSANVSTASGRIGILEAITSPDEAITYLKRFLAANPAANDQIDANLALGEAYEEKGDCTNSMNYLDKVVEATKDDRAAGAIYYQGRCYEKQGKPDDAKLAYKKVTLLYKLATDWVAKANRELQRLGV